MPTSPLALAAPATPQLLAVLQKLVALARPAAVIHQHRFAGLDAQRNAPCVTHHQLSNSRGFYMVQVQSILKMPLKYFSIAHVVVHKYFSIALVVVHKYFSIAHVALSKYFSIAHVALPSTDCTVWSSY